MGWVFDVACICWILNLVSSVLLHWRFLLLSSLEIGKILFDAKKEKNENNKTTLKPTKLTHSGRPWFSLFNIYNTWHWLGKKRKSILPSNCKYVSDGKPSSKFSFYPKKLPIRKASLNELPSFPVVLSKDLQLFRAPTYSTNEHFCDIWPVLTYLLIFIPAHYFYKFPTPNQWVYVSC